MILVLYEHKDQYGIAELTSAIENNSYDECDILPTWCKKMFGIEVTVLYSRMNDKNKKMISKFKDVKIEKYPVILQIEDDRIIAKHYLEDIALDDFNL